jgi:hypothetical protein
MATGASKAKRDAKKQAAKAYFNSLKQAEKVNPLKRIDTQGARKLSDQVGDDISYGAKRIAMQADKVGRKINADDSLNEGIKAYNKRFDEVQRQMNGETINKYEVVQDRSNVYMLDAISPNIEGQSGIGKLDSRDAAIAANPNPKVENKSLILGVQNTGEGNGFFGQKQEPTYSVKETKLTPISANYRNLGGTEGAYRDLEKLSKNLSNNPVTGFSKEYQALADKLRGKLKRDMGNTTTKPQGLLGSELAKASPMQEVIA